MNKIKKDIKTESEASYSKCEVDFKAVDSKVDWSSYSKKPKKSRKGLLWGSLAVAGTFAVVLAVVLPRFFVPAGVSDPGRLIAGDYSLDMSSTCGDTGGLAFADGQRISIVENGSSSGLGVVTLPGTDGTFKGTISFLDGPLKEYSFKDIVSVDLATYIFNMSSNEGDLRIKFGCDRDYEKPFYPVYIQNESKTVGCTVCYK